MTQALLIALMLWGRPAAAQDQAPRAPGDHAMPIGPSDCGLVTRYASHMIPDNCYQKAQNVVFDDDLGIQRRAGYAKFNAVAISTPAPIRRIYQFDAPDGNHYAVAVSSDKLWYASNTGSFLALTGTISPSENTACTQALGRLWCVNRVDGLFYWDGVVTSTRGVSAGPLGSLISNFRNRVLVADVSGNQSRLYASGFLDGEDWTTGSHSTNAFIQPVTGVNDGEKISCLMGTYGDAFIIGTPTRLFGLYGFDNDDFQLRELSREVGCIENTSVQEYDGSLMWLSRRGVERMRGTSIDWRVSDPILDLLQTIVAAGGNTVTLRDTTEADFQAGNLTASGPGAPVSAARSVNNVVPSTWTITDGSTTSFVAGSLVFVSTQSDSTIKLSTLFTNSGFQAGNFTNWTQENQSVVGNGGRWHINTASSCHTGSSFAIGGAYSASACTTVHTPPNMCSAGSHLVFVEILNANTGAIIKDKRFLFSDLGACAPHSIDVSTFTVPIKVRLYNACSANTSGPGSTTVPGPNITSPAFSTGSVRGLVRFGIGYHSVGSCDGVPYSNMVDVDVDFYEPYFVGFGTYTTQAFDTSFSTPTWDISSVSITSTTETSILLTRQASNDAISWSSSDLQRRYVRYLASFETLVATKTPTFESATLIAATTGYFISQCRATGADITSWGLFQCNHTIPENASIPLYVATGANCGAAISPSTAPWTLQLNNTVISVATAPYVAYRALFDFQSTTQVVTGMALQDCSITWNEGGGRPETASAVLDHRYYLFYTSSTAPGALNSNALVLDFRDRWSAWDNIPARSATMLQSAHSILIGDGAGNGQLYRLNSGFSDNGSAFTSAFRTKDFDLGDWRTRKEFIGVKLELSPLRDQADIVDMSITSHIDKAARNLLNTVSLGEDTGIVYGDVPTPLDSQLSGRYIGFEVSNTGTKDWRFFRGLLQFRPLRED